MTTEKIKELVKKRFRENLNYINIPIEYKTFLEELSTWTVDYTIHMGHYEDAIHYLLSELVNFNPDALEIYSSILNNKFDMNIEARE